MKFSKSLKAALLGVCAIASFIYAQAAQAETSAMNVFTPQEGYETAWKFVRDTYVDSKFSGQDWSAWEHKFNVQNADDEFRAIKTMMESLGDTYTRPQHAVQAATDKGLVASVKDGETPVKCGMEDGGVGYIKVSSFASPFCAEEVRKDLLGLSKAKSIVLDLRGNQGGLVSNALDIASLFLDDENIVTTVSRKGKQAFTAAGARVSNQPLVILVDGQTASASEILTAALQDNHRATVIGNKTFGKGLVQELCVIPGIVLRCTVSHYLTPSGTDLNKVGLTPDVQPSNHEDAMQLAMQLLQK